MRKKILMLVSLAMIFAAGGCQNTVGPVTEFFEIIEPKVDSQPITVLKQPVNDTKIIFRWRGSDLNFRYSHRLMRFDNSGRDVDYTPFTEFSSKTEVIFENLNEGTYRFIIIASFSGQEEERVIQFEIDAVSNASLTFYKLFTEAEVNKPFNLKLWCEGVNNIAAGDVRLFFNKDYLEFLGVSKGDEVTKTYNLEEMIISDPVDSVNSNGILNITFGIFGTIQSSPVKDFSGSGDIMILTFRPKIAGKTEVEILNNAVINGIGEDFPLAIPYRGQIEIK